MNLNADTFWQYSLQVYKDKKVAKTALALQDSYQVNVNMLLLLCWCLDNGAIVTLNQWKVLKAAIVTSDDKLYQHRKQRRLAKQATPFNAEVYGELKQQELALEMEQQEALTAAYNRLDVEYVPLSGINGSIAGFINLYGLRNTPEAVKWVTLVVQLSQSKMQHS
ncbi:TIGR02444 family protein [Alteromonas sp. C1M14]|uniref:TIGR02444 family protein n=1 Tax=Alteromonas sp. C1M14 TaxID=2841567 RepID=UPI001C07FCB1|nr:TIGR02444 family protein [Alteromonas sp. C1M14]MBU2978338.1 TIGR02444 family protein [Alteromonas sp. C1M14]